MSKINIKKQLLDCVQAYQKIGFFQDDRFLDEALIWSNINEALGFEDDDEIEAIDHTDLDVIYAALLIQDHAHVTQVDIKKAGAEGGDGYYQNMVEQLVGCFTDHAKVSEIIHEDIVTVKVEAQLSDDWRKDDKAAPLIIAEQSFMPNVHWTDVIFVEQLLKQLLGSKVRNILTRTGIDEENLLFIFAANNKAVRTIRDFEKKFLLDEIYVSGALNLKDIPELPQPNATNIDEILKKLGLEEAAVEELDAHFAFEFEESQQTKKKSFLSFLDVKEDWFSGFLAGFVVGMITAFVIFMWPKDDKCYAFETYLPDTNECVIYCEDDETQEACDKRAKKLRAEAALN